MAKMTEKTIAKANKDKTLAYYDRYLLTVEEAAIYFHIGSKKMRDIIDNHEGAKWYLYSGRRIMIKKDMFAKWLDQQTVI